MPSCYCRWIYRFVGAANALAGFVDAADGLSVALLLLSMACWALMVPPIKWQDLIVSCWLSGFGGGADGLASFVDAADGLGCFVVAVNGLAGFDGLPMARAGFVGAADDLASFDGALTAWQA